MRSIRSVLTRPTLELLKGAPTALWIYVALMIGSALVAVAQHVSAHPALILGTIGFDLVLMVGVLRGSRVAWSFVVVAELIGLLTTAFGTRPWWWILIGIVSLGSLLAPSSRRFVWRARGDKVAHWTGQTTWNPERDSDTDRPAGWYVDPRSPHRMRYWSQENAQWEGTTRTPRKIRLEQPMAPTSNLERQTTWDPNGYSDVNRPSGWYVDPDSPDRMRYWRAENSGWLTTAKTPRKIRKAWQAQDEN